MKLIINIQRKYFFVLLTLVLLILIIIFVGAFSNLPTFPNKASSLGHSVDEIDWKQAIQNTLWLGKSGVDLNSPTLYLKAYNPFIHIQDRSSEEYYIQTLAGSLSIFRRTNSEKDDLVIFNSNLGVDVSNPLDRLHINGPIRFGEGAILTFVEWDGTNQNPPCSPGFTALFRRYEATLDPQGATCIGRSQFPSCRSTCGRPAGWRFSLDTTPCNDPSINNYPDSNCCFYLDNCQKRECRSERWTKAVCIKGAT